MSIEDTRTTDPIGCALKEAWALCLELLGQTGMRLVDKDELAKVLEVTAERVRRCDY